MEDRMGLGMASVIFVTFCLMALLGSAVVAFVVVWLVDRFGK